MEWIQIYTDTRVRSICCLVKRNKVWSSQARMKLRDVPSSTPFGVVMFYAVFWQWHQECTILYGHQIQVQILISAVPSLFVVVCVYWISPVPFPCSWPSSLYLIFLSCLLYVMDVAQVVWTWQLSSHWWVHQPFFSLNCVINFQFNWTMKDFIS